MSVNSKSMKTLAERFIDHFSLVSDGEYIRFKDEPSRKTFVLTDLEREILIKYSALEDEEQVIPLVHETSFRKNPLRYVFNMINHCEISEDIRKERVAAVHELVRQAMEEDPLTTVQSIVFSMARVARF